MACALCGNPHVRGEMLHAPGGGIRTASHHEWGLCGTYVITHVLAEDRQTSLTRCPPEEAVSFCLHRSRGD